MHLEKVVYNGKITIGVSTHNTSIPLEALLPAAQKQLGENIDTAAGEARAPHLLAPAVTSIRSICWPSKKLPTGYKRQGRESHPVQRAGPHQHV